jgi:hypothetical protein
LAKLLVLLLLGSFACKWLAGRWPWELWGASERAQAEAQARTLLGVDRQASRDAVVDAHRRMIARVHPDRGGSADQVHAANDARDLLLAWIARRDRERS